MATNSTNTAFEALGVEIDFSHRYSILIAVAVCLLAGHRFFAGRDKEAAFWDAQYWIQPKGQLFFWARMRITSLYNLPKVVKNGYQKFSKKGLPYAVTTMLSGPVVMLPPDQIRKVFNQPERLIDGYFAQNDTIQSWYTIADPEIYDNDFHFKIVRNQLTRNISGFSEAIAEELQLGLDVHWGHTKDWRKVRIWAFCLKVISRAANRVFVGPELCRNEEFLEEARLYAMSIFGGALLIRMFPPFARPIVGRLVGLKCKWHKRKVNRAITPVIAARIANTKKKLADPSFDWEEPKDGLQWLLEECIKTKQDYQLEPQLVVKRLLILNMVAMHSTSFTTANTILDLFSSPDPIPTVALLREEVDRVLEKYKGVWSKEAVSELYRIDSTVRESMRMSGFGIVSLPRLVSDPAGLDINGIHIPPGIKLATAMHEVHQDDRLYTDPSRFDAFRFSRPREVALAKATPQEKQTDAATNANIADEEDEDGNPLGARELGATTVSDTFLSFGYGRHACPGRFFAVHEMKILLALILSNYDVDPLDKRPQDQMLVEVKVPSEYTTVKVRRRRWDKAATNEASEEVLAK